MISLLDRCASIRRDLNAFVDDELSGEGRLRVARHLETCSLCADEEAALRQIGVVLRAAASDTVATDQLAGLASSVLSRFKAESQASWRGYIERACDGWHWAVVGSGSLAATFVTTTILSLSLMFGSGPKNEDSLSALMNNLGSPAGDLFVFGSPVGDDEDTSVYQIHNGRPAASRMVMALAVPHLNRQVTEADLVSELATAVTRNGHVVALGTMDPEARRRTEALLDELTLTRLRSVSRIDNLRPLTMRVREMRLITSVTVTAKRL